MQPLPDLQVTNPDFLRELEHGSGINRVTIARAGLFVSSDPRALAKMRLLTARAWTDDHLPALVFPYPAIGKVDPVLFAAKPRTPIVMRDKDGNETKAAKYVRPRGILFCYLPPNIVASPELLSQRSVPVLVTEGEKKTLAACAHGFVCIGIAGVHTWGAAPKKAPVMDAWGVKDHLGVKRLFGPLEQAAQAGRDMFLVFDSDATSNLFVRAAEIDLAKQLTKSGATCYVVRLPPGTDGAKCGLDDFLVAHGADALLELMQAARKEGPVCSPIEAEHHRRPEVVIVTNRKVSGELALEALRGHPGIYQRGGLLARMTRDLGAVAQRRRLIDGSGAPRIGLLPKPVLGAELSNTASIIEPTPSGNTKPVHPPAWLLDYILERGEWEHFRPLTGITEVPVMLPDGELLIEPGYHEASGLYYEPARAIPQLPEHPSAEDVRYAREALDEVVVDFPFKAPEHQSAWVHTIATIVCRHAFQGPAPLALYDATTPGTGKTLGAELAALIATGRKPAKYQWSSEPAEQRKLITSIAIEGDRVVLFDNLQTEFGGAALCDALTATTWKDRILSVNKTFEGALNTVWLATGNNVSLGDDMSRRVAHIRLEATQERPEERSGFAHPNLFEWVREHQPQLLAALLTILRAYHLAGRPAVELLPWGSYEAWSAAVRAPLVWAGWPDPALTREQLITESCMKDAGAARLVREFKRLVDVIGECTAGKAINAIYPDVTPDRFTPSDEFAGMRNPFPELRDAIKELVGDKVNAKSLGHLLSKYRGRVLGGLVLRSRLLSGNTLWAVVSSAGGGSAGGEP